MTTLFIVEHLSQTTYVLTKIHFCLGVSLLDGQSFYMICWVLSFSRQLVLMSSENTDKLTYFLSLTINFGHSALKRPSKCCASHFPRVSQDGPVSILSNFWENIPSEPPQINQSLQTMHFLWWILSYIFPCFQLTKRAGGRQLPEEFDKFHKICSIIWAT